MSERVPTGIPMPQGAGEDPLFYYTKIFCRFLQLVFGTFEKGSYRWTEDENATDIIISDQATIGREVVEKRPAILVARGPASFGNLTMDQFAGPHFKNGELVYNQNPLTGARRFTDLVSCTVSYNCLSKEGLEAQRLAWICMMATRRLKRSLMKTGIHRVGEEMAVSAESSPGSIVPQDPQEIILVTVTVPFFFQDYWSVEPTDKLLLKRIDIALTSESGFPAEGAKVLNKYEPGDSETRAFVMNNKVVRYSKTVSLVQRIRVQDGTPKPR